MRSSALVVLGSLALAFVACGDPSSSSTDEGGDNQPAPAEDNDSGPGLDTDPNGGTVPRPDGGPRDEDAAPEEDAGEEPPPVPTKCTSTASPSVDPSVLSDLCGVFVAPNAKGTGTRANPLGTLADAIALAKKTGKSVFACIGTYAEAVTVENGISMYGNLDCLNGTIKASASHARIAPKTSPAGIAKGVSRKTRVEGFDFIAPDFGGLAPVRGKAAQSSIGFVAENSPALTIADAKIHGGTGQAGAAGGNAVDPVQEGSLPAASLGVSTCYRAPFFPGDPPGIDPFCRNARITSRAGGASKCLTGPGGPPLPDAQNGRSGGAGGAGGEFQWQRLPDPSTPDPADGFTAFVVRQGAGTASSTGDSAGPLAVGSAGRAGATGTGGGAIGRFGLSGYVPADGKPGQPGSGGQGGGGSNAVAHTQNELPESTYRDRLIYGATGSGGGAGGCGASPGTAGLGGGASVGLLAIASPLTLEDDVRVESAQGGAAGLAGCGAGIRGGDAAGARKGMAGLSSPTGFTGSGGPGGRAGASGGGGGGPSIAIAYRAGKPVFDAKAAVPGVGGKGATPSPSQCGADATPADRTLPGAAGVTAATLEVP